MKHTVLVLFALLLATSASAEGNRQEPAPPGTAKDDGTVPAGQSKGAGDVPPGYKFGEAKIEEEPLAVVKGLHGAIIEPKGVAKARRPVVRPVAPPPVTPTPTPTPTPAPRPPALKVSSLEGTWKGPCVHVGNGIFTQKSYVIKGNVIRSRDENFNDARCAESRSVATADYTIDSTGTQNNPRFPFSLTYSDGAGKIWEDGLRVTERTLEFQSEPNVTYSLDTRAR